MTHNKRFENQSQQTVDMISFKRGETKCGTVDDAHHEDSAKEENALDKAVIYALYQVAAVEDKIARIRDEARYKEDNQQSAQEAVDKAVYAMNKIASALENIASSNRSEAEYEINAQQQPNQEAFDKIVFAFGNIVPGGEDCGHSVNEETSTRTLRLREKYFEVGALSTQVTLGQKISGTHSTTEDKEYAHSALLEKVATSIIECGGQTMKSAENAKSSTPRQETNVGAIIVEGSHTAVKRTLPTQLTSSISEMSSSDVLDGRGRAVQCHPGNVRFIELIKQHHHKHVTGTKGERMQLRQDIVDCFRFMKAECAPKSSTSQAVWNEAPDHVALQKVKICFYSTTRRLKDNFSPLVPALTARKLYSATKREEVKLLSKRPLKFVADRGEPGKPQVEASSVGCSRREEERVHPVTMEVDERVSGWS